MKRKGSITTGCGFPGDQKIPVRIRSLVGLIPLFAVTTLDLDVLDRLPGFKRRMDWFTRHRPDLCGNIASITPPRRRSAIAAVHRASVAAAAGAGHHAG